MHHVPTHLTTLLITTVLLGCGTTESEAPLFEADIILHNADIITMDPGVPSARALAIVDDRIAFVGADTEAMKHAGTSTQVVDMQGQTIMPGFVDAHTHLFNWGNRAGNSLAAAQDSLLKYGVTTIGHPCGIEVYTALKAFESSGGLKVRTSVFLNINTNCGVLLGTGYLGEAILQAPGGRLWMNGVKLFTDGGTCGKRLAVSQARAVGYPAEGSEADLFMTQTELNQLVEQAHDAGYQVAIHAMGDLAVEQALNALENALDGEANTFRHRIEHNMLIRPDQIGRYGELGVIPVVLPTANGIRGWEPRTEFGISSERPWRSLIEANPGLPVAWQGDDPPIPPLDPFHDLQYYVTRSVPDGSGGLAMGDDWYTAQKVTVQQALEMMTLNTSYAVFREAETGSLETGKLADLIVISGNPRTVAPTSILDIRVLATMIGGEVLFGQLAPQ